MRELIINRIKDMAWLDYYFERGDNNARSFATYKEYLESLNDEDLLDTYIDVKRTEDRLD